MAEPGIAGLSAAHAAGRRADCELLSRRHQHASCAPCARRPVRGRGRQGHGEPDVAQGEERLGRVERPLAGRRADRAAHSRRHVVRVRLDRKATSISLLVVLGVRADGQKVLLAIKSMGGESAEAWRTVLDDLIRRGCEGRSSSSSMARPGSTRPSPPFGTACRSSAARFTSTGTCWRMRPSAFMTRSQRITTT